MLRLSMNRSSAFSNGCRVNTRLRHASEAELYGAITVEEVRNETDLEAIEGEWNDLLARSTSNLLFLTHEWVICWWRHFGRPRHLLGRAELFVLAVRKGGRLCGVAPLMIDVERFLGISVRVVRFLGHGVSDYADFILAGDREPSLQAIVQHLIRGSVAWDVIDLRDFYGASPHPSIFQSLFEAAGFVLRTEFDHVCPFIPIEGSWEAFYRSRFNRHHRKDHRREWRRLQAAGQPRIRFVTSFEAEPDLIERLTETDCYHPKGGLNREGYFKLDGYRGFLSEVLPKAANCGWLTVALLECGGRVAAYYLIFQYNRRYYVYLTSYHREFSRFGVGKLLMLRMLEQCWVSEGEEIDYLRGDERYKKDWAVQARQNLRLLAVRRSWRSRLRGWTWEALLPALQRRLPRLYGVLSFVSESSWPVVIKWLLRRLKRAACGGNK
jgi:CelD/BcsL family acetyltransferase involved in cellulose biosynthesis